ncbi:putative Galactoside 2-alpha-L-fucosyltransferase 1 [Hypsibius exemplaris]|uniref:L-Fucosyltransferase n=1 Tax=Hypsibius exemplaris TaxID=2072580 RepID=A0A9X6NE69_HYPEX|nr:putative Galactoside 2-alpha-L-fucosyltransferase 1 [Hypsibius exemplaris]
MEKDFMLKDRKTPLPLFVTLDAHEGRLGNRMFMTAALIGIARKNNRTPILFDAGLTLDCFEGLALEVASQAEILDNNSIGNYDAILREEGCCIFNNATENLAHSKWANKTIALGGYLQSWRYFDNIRDEIRRIFTFKRSIYEAAKIAILNGIDPLINRSATILQNQRTIPKIIGIHVRRGDILLDPHKSGGQVPATEEYLLSTVLEYQAKYSPAIFVVVSQDSDYCRKLFTRDHFIFIENTSAEIDMAIMSLMDEMIMTVGSYSFWGAYLNEQATDVTYYKNWPRPKSKLANQTHAQDYFLPTWHGRI